jgi:16S rRNA (uracil1498-N3)-methyltransferase
MTLHRFFSVERVPESGPIPLADSDVRHARDVLRLTPGDEIIVVDSTAASIVRLTRVGEVIEGERAGFACSPTIPRVVLAQGLAKGEKMDGVIRRVTELGVSRIVPFASVRSVVRLDADKAAARVERWGRIAAAAAKQAQLAVIPTIEQVTPLAELISLLGDALVLVCWEDATAEGVAEAITRLGPPAERAVAVVVGPEGGLTEDEVGILVAGGAEVVSLGPTTLRTETAGVVASVLALAARGGLGAHDE